MQGMVKGWDWKKVRKKKLESNIRLFVNEQDIIIDLR